MSLTEYKSIFQQWQEGLARKIYAPKGYDADQICCSIKHYVESQKDPEVVVVIYPIISCPLFVFVQVLQALFDSDQLVAALLRGGAQVVALCLAGDRGLAGPDTAPGVLTVTAVIEAITVVI